MSIDDWIIENLSTWNLSHQQFNYNGNFLTLQSESLGTIRRFSYSLIESVKAIGILPSNGFNSACIEEIFAAFII
jgi:hypothetical protein